LDIKLNVRCDKQCNDYFGTGSTVQSGPKLVAKGNTCYGRLLQTSNESELDTSNTAPRHPYDKHSVKLKKES